MLDIVMRESTEGCVSLYVGDIEINLEEPIVGNHSHENEDEELIA